jgi:hypothetical protein
MYCKKSNLSSQHKLVLQVPAFSPQKSKYGLKFNENFAGTKIEKL